MKNVGRGAVLAIIAARETPFTGLYDFVDRVCCDAVNKKAVESLIMAGALDHLPGTRTQKLEAVEKAVDGAAKKRRNTLEGQVSLFGMDESLPPPPLPPVRPEDPRALLQMEREVTGVYISGHPLDEYKEELSRFPVDHAALAAFADEPDGGLSHDGEIVEMAGMVAEKKLKATKSGGLMAFVQLEDLRGVTEALVFPRVYEKYQPLLEPEGLVVMRGRLSVREEEAPKIIPDEVRALCHGDSCRTGGVAEGANGINRRDSGENGYSAYRPRSEDADLSRLPPSLREEIVFREGDDRPDARRLTIELPTRADRETAARILMPTPGLIQVVFRIASEGREEKAPRNLWVSENFDRAALARVFGEKAIELR